MCMRPNSPRPTRRPLDRDPRFQDWYRGICQSVQDETETKTGKDTSFRDRGQDQDIHGSRDQARGLR